MIFPNKIGIWSWKRDYLPDGSEAKDHEIFLVSIKTNGKVFYTTVECELDDLLQRGKFMEWISHDPEALIGMNDPCFLSDATTSDFFSKTNKQK